MSITYTATLGVRDETVFFLSGLLHAEQQRRGTRRKRRALSCFKQAVLVLRWLLDSTRMKQLAGDNGISRSTGYDYVHEGVNVLAAQAPSLYGAATGRESRRVRLRPSRRHPDRNRPDRHTRPHRGRGSVVVGKHKNHGGNVQVLTAPHGWPLWTSRVRPGREHDTTCLRTHPDLLDTLAAIRADLRTLADLGTKAKPTPSLSRSRPRRTGSSPTSSSSSIAPTTGSVRSANAATACSR